MKNRLQSILRRIPFKILLMICFVLVYFTPTLAVGFPALHIVTENMKAIAAGSPWPRDFCCRKKISPSRNWRKRWAFPMTSPSVVSLKNTKACCPVNINNIAYPFLPFADSSPEKCIFLRSFCFLSRLSLLCQQDLKTAYPFLFSSVQFLKSFIPGKGFPQNIPVY